MNHTNSTIESLSAGDLRIEVIGQDPICCIWRGKSNDRYPAKLLAPYFDALLQTAESTPTAVEMHFEELAHFNSSTITAMIQLIHNSRTRGVRLALVYDESMKWQKLSFDALRVFVKADGLFTLRPKDQSVSTQGSV